MSSGLTELEERISRDLIDAWNVFCSLENNATTDEYIDFKNGIHQCQYVLMHRIVSREHPEYWI